MGPLPNGENGRDAGGRFSKGWKGGPGNPHAAQMSKLRSALLSALSEDDITGLVAKLKKAARVEDAILLGDIAAIKLLLAYAIGAPPSFAEVQELLSDAKHEEKMRSMGF